MSLTVSGQPAGLMTTPSFKLWEKRQVRLKMRQFKARSLDAINFYDFSTSPNILTLVLESG